MTLRHSVLALAMGATCCAAGAADNLKPGLWEITTKMSSSSGEMEKAMAEMQKQMASMAPEQRKMMQEAMAKHGVGMGEKANSVKMCMTREMVERNDFGAQKGDCKNTMAPRSGNTLKMSFVCSNPATSGESQITFNGPESYTSKTVVNSAGPQGKPEKMTMDAAGKWLSADCGNIKPVNLPK